MQKWFMQTRWTGESRKSVRPPQNAVCLGRPQHCCRCSDPTRPWCGSSDPLVQVQLYLTVCTDVSQEFFPSLLQVSTDN